MVIVYTYKSWNALNCQWWKWLFWIMTWFRLNLIRLLSLAAMVTLISAYYIVYLLWCCRPLIKVIVPFMVERSVIKVHSVDVSFSTQLYFCIYSRFISFAMRRIFTYWAWCFIILWKDNFHFKFIFSLYIFSEKYLLILLFFKNFNK